MGRVVVLLWLGLLSGCFLPDPDPTEETIPGFDPCTASHLERAAGYSVCPEDADFPYGEWIAGIVVGAPAYGGDPLPVTLQTQQSDDWSLAVSIEAGFSLQQARWWSEVEAEAPSVELRVEAPCGDSESWFAGRSASTGDLIAAVGTAARVDIDGWSIDAGVPAVECPEPISDCPCSDECTVGPVRYTAGSLSLDLYPSQRGFVTPDAEALTFSNWTTDEPSSCEDGAVEGRRWLVLGYGAGEGL
jgi:hypothetical protein